MRKVSVLEKLGLIRTINDSEVVIYDSMDGIETMEEQEEGLANLEGISIGIEGLLPIDAIYDKAGLAEKETSIFKVADIATNLPDTLPTKQKVATTLKLLSAMHLEEQVLLEDGYKRINALEQAELAFKQEIQEQVQTYRKQMARLEKEMDSLREALATRLKEEEMEEKLLHEEIDQISNILAFMGQKEAE